MITIEKEQLESLKLLLSIVIAVVPVLFGFLIWAFRRVDYGGKARVTSLRNEFDEIIAVMRTHISSLEDERVFSLSLIQKYEKREVEMTDKLQVLQDDFDKIKMEINILRENDEAKAKSILENALRIIVSLGYSKDLGKMYVMCLEGKLPIETFTAALKLEQVTPFPVDRKENK